MDLKGNLFIVKMEKEEHSSVAKLLQDCFKIPNGGVRFNPLITLGVLRVRDIPSGYLIFGLLLIL